MVGDVANCFVDTDSLKWKTRCLACNLSLFFGNFFSNKSFHKFSRSMSNPPNFGSDTCMMAFP